MLYHFELCTCQSSNLKKPPARTGGFHLALYAACGETAGQVLFDGHEQYHHGDDCKDGGCEEILPLDHIVAVENVDANGQRLKGIGGDQAQGHGVFIPGVDENENQGGDNAGGCHGQQNSEHGLDTVAAVNGGRLLHLRGDAHKGTPQEPDGKCLVKGRIDENQAKNGVRQVQDLHDLVDTDQQNHRGEHLGHDDKAQEGRLAFELHAGQGVGRRNTAEHGDDGGAACNEDGVQHVFGHGRSGPDVHKVRPHIFNGEHGTVDAENLLTAFQSRAEHNKIGVENKQADEHHHKVEEDPAQELFPVNTNIVLHSLILSFLQRGDHVAAGADQQNQEADDGNRGGLALLAIVEGQLVEVGNQGIGTAGGVALGDGPDDGEGIEHVDDVQHRGHGQAGLYQGHSSYARRNDKRRSRIQTDR